MQHQLSPLFDSVIQEGHRCAKRAIDFDEIDLMAADGCRFNEGMLYGFQKVLETIIDGKDVVEMIRSELEMIADENNRG